MGKLLADRDSMHAICRRDVYSAGVGSAAAGRAGEGSSASSLGKPGTL